VGAGRACCGQPGATACLLYRAYAAAAIARRPTGPVAPSGGHSATPRRSSSSSAGLRTGTRRGGGGGGGGWNGD